MAKGCYVGVNGVARKVKKIYVGVDGIARKVKKAYIGVGGVARLFWRSGPSYKIATKLDYYRGDLAAATVGEYALFAGGYNSGSSTSRVESYDASLTRATGTSLSAARCSLAATTVGDYAIFAGGRSSALINTVDAYSSPTAHKTAPSLSTARRDLAATTVGDYAIFAGGAEKGSSRQVSSKIVDAYNSSLTHKTVTDLSTSRAYLAATTVGNRAIFAGGCFNLSSMNSVSTVDVYDASSTGLAGPMTYSLDVSRYWLAATTVGDYAIFAGGYYRQGDNTVYPCDTVDVYGASLTKHSAPSLSAARRSLAATTVGDYAIFAGGLNSDVVDIYDASLTREIGTSLSQARYLLAAATVDNYAIFGGGYSGGSNPSNVVDVYTI